MSEYVYLLQATEEQYQKIMNLLDLSLKKSGIEALQDVVEIYNVMVSAQKLQVPPQEPESVLPAVELPG